MIRRIALSLAAIVALVAAVPVNGSAEAQTPVTRHMRPASHIGQAQIVGHLPTNTVMQLDVVLQLRDRDGLRNLLAQQYDPQSPLFHKWITPAEFTERFGPTQNDYDAVVDFAKSHGFAVVGGSRDSFEIQIKGTAAQVEHAFHVAMQSYRDPADGKNYFAPDREPSLDLPFQVWHVSGIDNFAKPHPLFVKKSDYAKAHGISPEEVVSHATTGSGPSASFLGSDMRAAYYGTGSLTGAGLNLGLFEYEGTDLADLRTYYTNVHQTLPITPILLSTDGTSVNCSGSCDDTEQTLDMTQILGMAPGEASLTVYVGSVDTAIIGAMTTNNPLPLTIGCSWGWTPADPSTLDPYFEKMATQGQTFFAASGDSSTWSKSNEAWPADDANIISVGGTDLVTASAAGPWKSETAWADSGGGISPDSIAIPSWQKPVINSSNKGSTTLRNGPDVSANANFTFYTCADQKACQANAYGGTSFAAPMWAGYIALADQQAGKGLGFIDPAMYTIEEGGSYGTDFHDITSGTSGSYSAVVGYDLVTGIGSPNGANLINALAGGTQQPGYSLSANPSSLSVQQGSAGNSTITVAVTGGFNSAVAFTSSGAPSGVTVGFNPSSVTGAGSTTATFTVASGTATGSYPITITGTSGTTVETTTVTLTVTSVGNPAFSISATPSSQNITRGSSGNYTVTVTGTGGFSGVVTLSATGEGNNQTVSFNPTTVTGSGTSTMTVHAGTRGTGTHTITIKGTSGTTSHTTTVSATIVR